MAPCVGAVDGSTWTVAVTTCISVVSFSVSLCLCLCSTLVLAEPTNILTLVSLSLAETPGPWVPGWAPMARQDYCAGVAGGGGRVF